MGGKILDWWKDRRKEEFLGGIKGGKGFFLVINWGERVGEKESLKRFGVVVGLGFWWWVLERKFNKWEVW